MSTNKKAALSVRERHQRLLRQWAAKIVSELPSRDDAPRVLMLARQLASSWLAPVSGRTAKSRLAPKNDITEQFALVKERRLRQWAAKIVSELPTEAGDAKKVLRLAQQLAKLWLGDRAQPGRDARGAA